MVLTQLLQAYEPHFLDSLSLKDSSHLEQSVQQWVQIRAIYEKERNSGSLTKEDEKSVFRVAARVKMIASLMLEMEQDSQSRLKSYDKACEAVLASQEPTAFTSIATSKAFSSSTKQSNSEASSSDNLPSKELRSWILENLADPFPSRQDKEKLVKKTNLEEQGKATLSYNQVVLWFTNARRRCGWTVFFRRFADSDKAHMAEVLRILSDESDHEISALSQLFLEWKADGCTNRTKAQALAKDCVEAYQVMLDWIHDKHTLRMGEWMKDVEIFAAETKRKEKERRKNRKRAIKEYGGTGDKRVPSTRSSTTRSHSNSNASSSSRSISGQSSTSSSLWSGSNRTYSTSSIYSTQNHPFERDDSLTPPPPLSQDNSPPNTTTPTISSSSQNLAVNGNGNENRTKSPSSFIYKPRNSYSNMSNVRGNHHHHHHQQSPENSISPPVSDGNRSSSNLLDSRLRKFPLPIPPPNFSNQNLYIQHNLPYTSISSTSPGSDGGYSLNALNSLQNSPNDSTSVSTPNTTTSHSIQIPNFNQIDNINNGGRRSESSSFSSSSSQSNSKGKKRQMDEIEIEVDLNEFENQHENGKRFKFDGNGNGNFNNGGGRFDFDFQTDFASGNVGNGNGFLPDKWVPYNGQI